jgi:hypothetical protein
MSRKDISSKDKHRIRRERNLAAKSLREKQFRQKILPEKKQKFTLKDLEYDD